MITTPSRENEQETPTLVETITDTRLLILTTSTDAHKLQVLKQFVDNLKLSMPLSTIF